MNELENFFQKGNIELEFTESAYNEASKGSDQRADKAAEYTWCGATNQFGGEDYWRKVIAQAVFPGQGLTSNQKNDVENLLVAKLTDAIFITRDGASRRQPRGILGSRTQLEELGIKVMNPEEALNLAQNEA